MTASMLEIIRQISNIAPDVWAATQAQVAAEIWLNTFWVIVCSMALLTISPTMWFLPSKMGVNKDDAAGWQILGTLVAIVSLGALGVNLHLMLERSMATDWRAVELIVDQIR